MKRILIISLFILLLSAQADARCVASQQRIDPHTTLVFVDMDCNGYVDTVETWKWDGHRWILVGVRPY